MSAPVVRARGLVKRFGPVTALRGVDLSIEPGRVCAILGPNGAGKSTLLRILAGLARATGGELEILGRAARGAASRGRIGFVGHATWLYPELSAFENLVFAARLYAVGDPRARAGELVAEFGLSDWAARRAGDLSRGLSQRLSIARALVHDPALVLLDEPFTGLDRRSAGRLVDQLARLRDQGRTLAIVTHEPGQVASVADQALVLAGGRVHREQAQGPLDVAALEAAVLEATEAPR